MQLINYMLFFCDVVKCNHTFEQKFNMSNEKERDRERKRERKK